MKTVHVAQGPAPKHRWIVETRDAGQHAHRVETDGHGHPDEAVAVLIAMSVALADQDPSALVIHHPVLLDDLRIRMKRWSNEIAREATPDDFGTWRGVRALMHVANVRSLEIRGPSASDEAPAPTAPAPCDPARRNRERALLGECLDVIANTQIPWNDTVRGLAERVRVELGRSA